MVIVSPNIPEQMVEFARNYATKEVMPKIFFAAQKNKRRRCLCTVVTISYCGIRRAIV
jgi:hypothetical protein